MIKNSKKFLCLLVLMFSFSVFFSGTTFASNVTEGCTPGYWKNHTEVWFFFKPSDTLEFAFSTNPYCEGLIWGMDEPQWWIDIKGTTMLEALKFKGGNGLDGARRIFFRAAVAALLNGLAYDQIYNGGQPMVYYYAGGYVLWHIQFQLRNSEIRQEFLAFAADWDHLNNLGCPLNNYGLRK